MNTVTCNLWWSSINAHWTCWLACWLDHWLNDCIIGPGNSLSLWRTLSALITPCPGEEHFRCGRKEHFRCCIHYRGNHLDLVQEPETRESHWLTSNWFVDGTPFSLRAGKARWWVWVDSRLQYSSWDVKGFLSITRLCRHGRLAPPTLHPSFLPRPSLLQRNEKFSTRHLVCQVSSIAVEWLHNQYSLIFWVQVWQHDPQSM